MKNIIKVSGTIKFDLPNKTKKHNKQSKWKKIAMVVFTGDICEYYSWFLDKKYLLKLNRPLRGPHISFINDSINDIMKGLNVSEKGANKAWNRVKKKWDGKRIDILLDVSPKSNGSHWWLVVPEEGRYLLHSIRGEIGLNRPHFGLHMSLGYPQDTYDLNNDTNGVKAKRMNVAHSKYILDLIRKGRIE